MSTIFLNNTEDAESILRTSANKQLDSYADEWIMIFEGLQNALDAVEDVDNPKVKVIFDIVNNKVLIYDNGKGFPCNKVFFSLGKGEKSNTRNHNIRGEHGVGMKMIILCSKQFELITRNPKGKLWYARFNNGFKFLNNGDEEFFDTECIEYERLPKGYNTLIEYTFPFLTEKPMRILSIRSFIVNIFKEYEGIVPYEEFLKNRSKASLYVEHYFRTHSYSGDVNRLFDNKKPAEIEIIIKKDTGMDEANYVKTYDLELRNYWKMTEQCSKDKRYEIKFPSKYWDLSEIYSDSRRKGIFNEEALKAFNPNVKYGGSHAWVIKITDENNLKELLVSPSLNNYNKLDNFNNLLSAKIKGIYLVIASASKSAKYNISSLLLNKADQIIAADGVLTTNPIRAPKKGKNQSYLNNIHIVININDRVNYGKQGIKNPKLLSNIYKYFEQIYVSKLVYLAISVAGKIPVENQDEYIEPDVIITELPNIKSNLSIKKIPKHENTVIAIFYELIGKGIIKGINTYQLSSFNKYDGDINIFYKTKNKFKTITRDNDLLNIEFKVNLSDLIKDFEDNYKKMSDLSLVVVWNKDLLKNNNYYLLDLEQSGYSWIGITGVSEVLAHMDGNQVPIVELTNYVKIENNK
jgi:hypothetical protein